MTEEKEKQIHGMTREILLLCLQYKRCRGCYRIFPRKYAHYKASNFCGFCRNPQIAVDEAYMKWYNEEGHKLDDILPLFIPKFEVVRHMLIKNFPEKEKGKN